MLCQSASIATVAFAAVVVAAAIDQSVVINHQGDPSIHPSSMDRTRLASASFLSVGLSAAAAEAVAVGWLQWQRQGGERSGVGGGSGGAV